MPYCQMSLMPQCKWLVIPTDSAVQLMLGKRTCCQHTGLDRDRKDQDQFSTKHCVWYCDVLSHTFDQ